MERNGLCTDAETIKYADILLKELLDGTFMKDTTPNTANDFSGEMEHHDYLECIEFTGTKFFESIINVGSDYDISELLPKGREENEWI